MLSEEEAISILDSNQIVYKQIRLGTQNNLKAKFPNGYSLIIKPDESKPGYLRAYLNNNESGVLINWNEINHKSLALAIKNIKELLDIEVQKTDLELVKTQEIKSEQVNNVQEIQLEQIDFQETMPEKRLLNKQRWFAPAIALLSFLLVGFGYFATNRLIAACNSERSEMRSSQP